MTQIRLDAEDGYSERNLLHIPTSNSWKIEDGFPMKNVGDDRGEKSKGCEKNREEEQSHGVNCQEILWLFTAFLDVIFYKFGSIFFKNFIDFINQVIHFFF